MQTERNIKPNKVGKEPEYPVLFAAIFCIIVIFLIAFSFKFVNYQKSNIFYSHCIMEAGDFSFSAEDFLKNSEKKISFDKSFSPKDINTSVPGDYNIPLKSGIFHFTSTLTIEDTTAPTATVHSVQLKYGETAKPADFIKSCFDVQEISCTFDKTPDFTKIGPQDVNIVFEDKSGNITTKTSVLFINSFKEEVIWDVNEDFPDLKDFTVDTFYNFVKDLSPAKKPHITTSIKDIDISSLGSYDISISYQGNIYKSKIVLVDTVCPVAIPQNFVGYTTSVITPDIFVKESSDVTTLFYEFSENYDFSLPGSYPVKIKITDKGENTVEVEALATLKEDTVPPVIKGVRTVYSMEGEPIGFRVGVSVSDNCDKDILLNVTSDDLDYKTPGTYDILYSATDRAGNHTEIKAKVIVQKITVTKEQVSELADKVIEKIIKPEMTDREKLTAIYNWVRSHTNYQHSTNHSDYLKAAYTGFTSHSGDCYVYMSQSKALLDAAGIKNMIIDTYPLRNIHYWNLVDIGEGWYHFDTTPRLDGGTFLYINDATITAYSKAHDNSHIYDKERFPDIK